MLCYNHFESCMNHSTKRWREAGLSSVPLRSTSSRRCPSLEPTRLSEAAVLPGD